MTHYSGSVPAYERAADWQESAACRGLDDDTMFPGDHAPDIRHAKSYCGTCPVWLTCVQEALRTDDIKWGIRGALKPSQLQAVAARLNEGQWADRAAVLVAVQYVLQPRADNRTLDDLWNDHAFVMGGGHMGWQGAGSGGSFSWKGQVYTPNQVSFLVDRGHAPDGQVRRICEVEGCVHPRHIADNTERAAAKTAARRAGATV